MVGPNFGKIRATGARGFTLNARVNFQAGGVMMVSIGGH